ADGVSVRARAWVGFRPAVPPRWGAVTAVWVRGGVFSPPFGVTPPAAVNNSGFVPARVSAALFRATALPSATPAEALAWSVPRVTIRAPMPMAAPLPKFRVVPPPRAVEPLRLLAVGRVNVPPPAAVQLVPLP